MTNMQLHRKLWNFLADLPELYKHDWPDWPDHPEATYHSHCFACLTAHNRHPSPAPNDTEQCILCPLRHSDGTKLCGPSGLYTKYRHSPEGSLERSNYARQIAQLPWRSTHECLAIESRHPTELDSVPF